MNSKLQNVSARSPGQPFFAVEWQQLKVKRAFQASLGKMLQNEPRSREDRPVPYLGSPQKTENIAR